MTTDFETLASYAFHQLYDHSLSWDGGGGWLSDDCDALANERAAVAGYDTSEELYLPTGITQAAVMAAGAELLLEEQVALARCDDRSWRDIAVCLGVHPSAAHRRWGPRVAARVEQETTRRREWAESQGWGATT